MSGVKIIYFSKDTFSWFPDHVTNLTIHTIDFLVFAD